jgi:hypothetical protein
MGESRGLREAGYESIYNKLMISVVLGLDYGRMVFGEWKIPGVLRTIYHRLVGMEDCN